ncbi:MAG: SMR family transporter [bacterium]|nr:SMR family transporter [bacterium]
MRSPLIFWVFIVTAVLFEALGDIFFKSWATANRFWMLGVGLAVYFVGTLFWAISLKHEGLARAISIFTVVNLIIIVLVGVLFFDEQLTGLHKIGIALGVLSVALLEI